MTSELHNIPQTTHVYLCLQRRLVNLFNERPGNNYFKAMYYMFSITTTQLKSFTIKITNKQCLMWLRAFPGSSDGKESTCNVGDLSLIPGLARSPGEGKDYSLQYSVLGNSMDCIVHGVAESDKTDRLSLSLSLSQVRFLHLLI